MLDLWTTLPLGTPACYLSNRNLGLEQSLVLRAKRYKYLVLLKPLCWITEGGLFCEPPGKEENSLWNFSPYILRTQSSKTRCILLESLNFGCLLKDPVSNQVMICDKTHDGGGGIERQNASFGFWFQRFSSSVEWPCCFETVVTETEYGGKIICHWRLLYQMVSKSKTKVLAPHCPHGMSLVEWLPPYIRPHSLKLT